MIRHIFQILWNERKRNFFILIEFILIFCILWFCSDYLWFMGRRYIEPRGFDIENVFQINLAYRAESTLTEEEAERSKDGYGNALALLERVGRYPGVEAVSLSEAALPYGGSTYIYTYSLDTLHAGGTRRRAVTEDYFKVYRIDVQGEVFRWSDPADEKRVILTPDFKNEFLDTAINRVQWFYSSGSPKEEDTPDLLKIGTTGKMKLNDFEPYANIVYLPLERDSRNILFEPSIRVSPEASEGFEERFTRDMRSQLDFGTRYLREIKPVEKIRKEANQNTNNTLNGVFSVTGFLIVNIFLGVLGTFWFRTQSRRGEIGLRMALGASRRKVKGLLIGETVLLLAVAAIAGTIICLNIGHTDLLESIGGLPNFRCKKS